MMTSARRFVACLVIGLLVGCTASPSPRSEGPSAAPSSIIGSGSADTCRPIDLRSPTGERIDLTGTWEGSVFVNHVRQVGDCVWWIGYGRWPGTEPGELATLTFFGHVSNDFTVSGSWATIVQPDAHAVYYPGPRDGHVAFMIGFDPETGVATTLTRVGAGITDRDYSTDELRRVGPLPESANPPAQ